MSNFDIAAACARNPNYRNDLNHRIAELEKAYALRDYQKQLDEKGIPVQISQFADQDEDIIKCIMGGLLMFEPDRKETRNG